MVLAPPASKYALNAHMLLGLPAFGVVYFWLNKKVCTTINQLFFIGQVGILF